MSRMPPSLSGGLPCAVAALADIASTAARMLAVALFTESSLLTPHCLQLSNLRRDHAAWQEERQGGQHGHDFR